MYFDFCLLAAFRELFQRMNWVELIDVVQASVKRSTPGGARINIEGSRKVSLGILSTSSLPQEPPPQPCVLVMLRNTLFPKQTQSIPTCRTVGSFGAPVNPFPCQSPTHPSRPSCRAAFPEALCQLPPISHKLKLLFPRSSFLCFTTVQPCPSG